MYIYFSLECLFKKRKVELGHCSSTNLKIKMGNSEAKAPPLPRDYLEALEET